MENKNKDAPENSICEDCGHDGDIHTDSINSYTGECVYRISKHVCCDLFLYSLQSQHSPQSLKHQGSKEGKNDVLPSGRPSADKPYAEHLVESLK